MTGAEKKEFQSETPQKLHMYCLKNKQGVRIGILGLGVGGA